jgi:hypothetical protein
LKLLLATSDHLWKLAAVVWFIHKNHREFEHEIVARELSTRAGRRRDPLVLPMQREARSRSVGQKIALPVNDSPVCETMIQAPIGLEVRALLEPNGQRFLLLLDRTISLPVG